MLCPFCGLIIFIHWFIVETAFFRLYSFLGVIYVLAYVNDALWARPCLTAPHFSTLFQQRARITLLHLILLLHFVPIGCSSDVVAHDLA